MNELIGNVPPIDFVLAAAIAVATIVSFALKPRGGRFRGLPGWAGMWVYIGLILISLSLAPRWFSFALLALVMFIALRAYFSLVPVRPGDRYAVLATYLAIPFALYPAFVGSADMFTATVPVTLFLLVPVVLGLGKAGKGLLDSIGRTLLGVVFFVYCAAYIGLLSDLSQWHGLPELFGILVLAAELPQRVLGRVRSGTGWLGSTSGIVIGFVLAGVAGYWLAPWCGIVEEDGSRAGVLIAIAVTLGAVTSNAVAEDLKLSAASRWGRGAILDRVVPAVYAAPVFYHYLSYYA